MSEHGTNSKLMGLSTALSFILIFMLIDEIMPVFASGMELTVKTVDSFLLWFLANCGMLGIILLILSPGILFVIDRSKTD